MTSRKSLSTRRLISSMLYMFSAAFFITNLATGGAASFSAVDLGLVIGGVACWIAAGSHSVFGNARRLYYCETEPEDVPPRMIRGSSHSIINASLYAASAVFFVAGDALNAATPAYIRWPRLTGSSLWLLSSLSYLAVAIFQERPQEDRPDEDVRFLGLRQEFFYFLNESEYLAAGIFYAAAIYLASPIPVWKAAGNGCWLLASTHEVFRTLMDVVVKEEADETGAPGLQRGQVF